MRRSWIMLLAVALALAVALPAGAGKPDSPGRPTPDPDPEVWTCKERVANGAAWVLGEWSGDAYVSDSMNLVEVDTPLCIDIGADHRNVTDWYVAWTGQTARKDPRGLSLVFEEEVHNTVYAQTEVTPTGGEPITSGTKLMTLDFSTDDDVTHLVFVAMPRAGDKWGNISFTVTPVMHPTP